ncbi:protein FAR-RED IMPAIRED RESPONSE 1-like [Chenopodium quinoa]|uniref:protein FAR-RED IMPAIRED RESPONSE 1-like n=1 Tax=Chenopodium quinoa TaxID=63459 RepID=UPI000B795EB4|nr:protein FAR-RED IMPAIRED RESPONSE 1-like [Chenopodium quinoa]
MAAAAVGGPEGGAGRAATRVRGAATIAPCNSCATLLLLLYVAAVQHTPQAHEVKAQRSNVAKKGYVTNNKKPGKQVEGACLKRKTVKRVGCPAKIKFRFCTGGKYMVYYFYEYHSHPFSTPITRQVTKHEVGLNFAHKKFIFDNSKLNIGVIIYYRIMKELCGGFQNVRGSKDDFKKISRDLKVYISNADGAMFVQNLEQKVKTSKGGYYFDYCVDGSRHLTRAFWADAIGRRDYQLFGDSLSFDFTYDTNKYSLCMGREPSCVITDQDPAMGIAIEKVFTKNKHRLCMWHIMRKVPEKVGTAFCNETDFLKKLSAVVWDREIDPHVFVNGWNSVMEEFNLVDHEWHEHDELYRLNKLEPQLVTNLHLEKHAAFSVWRWCGVSVIVDHEKRKNFDVNFDLATYESSCTCRMFESQGVLCRHILFVMKGKSIREIPDSYILYRWRKDVLKKASVIDVALDDASKYDKKKQLFSDVLSKLFSCVSLTDQSEDDLFNLIRTLSSFEEQMISKNNPENAPSSKEVKDADIQVLVGSNEVDVNVLPPNRCLNKGYSRSSKRLKSAKEIATEEKSKKGRTCRACGQSGVSHDSRNCPNK